MKTILIVDDDSDFRTFMKTMIKGFKILEASDGEKAISLAISADIILTDICMPHMNGLEFIQKIHQKVDAPIIAITGFLHNVDAAVQAGAQFCLVKPFTADELDCIIENFA